MGQTGPAGTLTGASRQAILTKVQSQIEDIFGELNVQMRRMAQLQVQVDEVRASLRRVLGVSD